MSQPISRWWCTGTAAPTVKQHLAGMLKLFDWLIIGKAVNQESSKYLDLCTRNSDFRRSIRTRRYAANRSSY
jgi:hypothetical protein